MTEETTQTRDDILRIAIHLVYDKLNALIGECTDEAGKVKVPTMKTLMKAKAALPPQYSNAFKK